MFMTVWQGHGLHGLLWLQPPSLEKAEISASIEDDVVKQRNANDAAGGLELPGHLKIGCLQLESAGRMVVSDDVRRSAVHQGVREHLARMNGRSIDQAARPGVRWLSITCSNCAKIFGVPATRLPDCR